MFKSDRFRKFLFATDQDKKKGNINPLQIKSPATSLTTNSTMTPKMPSVGIIKPTSIPGLPSMPKMPKFGKVKKYLKKNF